jgi:hypothetical protein
MNPCPHRKRVPERERMLSLSRNLQPPKAKAQRHMAARRGKMFPQPSPPRQLVGDPHPQPQHLQPSASGEIPPLTNGQQRGLRQGPPGHRRGRRHYLLPPRRPPGRAPPSDPWSTQSRQRALSPKAIRPHPLQGRGPDLPRGLLRPRTDRQPKGNLLPPQAKMSPQREKLLITG